MTDGQVASASVGAVAMAPSDPDIVYIGMGEVQLRANVLQGDGVYRSDDGGTSWRHLGLAETHAIGRIRIHPTDPDRLYVAALGHPFGPNPERGIYRTGDGGRTWEKVLFRDERTGAVDLAMDPADPNVLYATLWQVVRRPWHLWSGGPGSGIFKSTDGGDTWSEITRHPGLPEGVLGKITVTVSGADPNRVWANLEAERGGLYRSDDGGRSWEFINGHRDIWQRAFYFQRLEADPVDRDTLYILNFRLMRSTDGGKTLESVPETHADHHDLWIDPTNPLRMINGNDGGGVVTVNGGRTWTSMRYPTAQIYRLTTTSDFPITSAARSRTTRRRAWRPSRGICATRAARARSGCTRWAEAKWATSRNTPPMPTSSTRERPTPSPATTGGPAWSPMSSPGRASSWANLRATCPSDGTGPIPSPWLPSRRTRCTPGRSTCGGRSTRAGRGRG